MWHKMKEFAFLNRRASWIGWFVVVHLIQSSLILFLMMLMGINPTLVVSVIAAPLWIAVAFVSKFITDKIMERA
tara:strand:- start:246 stop:467 length:222 start_codon:yes stop_codon:yes gene_type:complete